MEALTLNAPAKVNLTLQVLDRRSDGYHDLKTVMTSVSLCDAVTVRLTGGGAVTVSVPGTDLPGGEDNLAGKAARVFLDAMSHSGGAEITVEKHIPVRAGLGGGSSDAAAVLRALRRLAHPEMPLRELAELGGAVGSDVPYCVLGGTALAEGRGERLTTWPDPPPCFIVLCKPEFDLSTPEMFARIDAGARRSRPDHAAVYAGLLHGELAAISARLHNDFEAALAADEAAQITAIKDRMRECGAQGALMSGSGPTVFGLFRHPGGAQRAWEELREFYPETFLARPFS